MSHVSRRGMQDALRFHALFFAIAIPTALYQQDRSLGMAILLLTLAYNISLPLMCQWRGYREGVRLWWFLLPLSLALPCADWMLVRQMGTLSFPDHGIYRLGGAVPIYFMGLWIMLLWPLCWLAQSTRRPYLFTAMAALAAFLIWEWAARPLNLWHAVGVKQVAGFALYPLIPEMLLAIAALWMWQHHGRSPLLTRLACAISVAIFYAGALSLALLWIG
ncbi:MAG: hypothetical protein V4730_10665 [Pseudomonadota bacterium]